MYRNLTLRKLSNAIRAEIVATLVTSPILTGPFHFLTAMAANRDLCNYLISVVNAH